MAILKNKAQCNKCKDIIESTHVHDFRQCKCGAIFVDGGREYVRRGGELEDIIELSEYKDLELSDTDEEIKNER